MKFRHLAFAAAAAALTLSACATTPTTRMTEGKADAALWVSLDAASQTLTGLATSGKLHGAPATKAKAKLVKFKAAVQATDDAYAKGDAATAEQNAALAGQLLAELTGIFAAAK